MKTLKDILHKKEGKLYLPFVIYGLLGLIVEVFFTAIQGNLVGYDNLQYLSLVGRTSVWMIFVYGLGGSVISFINEIPRYYKLPMLYQTLIGGFAIAVIELISGCILNLWLGLNIWNYSGQPNILGQVCLINSILFTVSIPAFIWFIDFISWALYREDWYYNVLDNYRELFRLK